jgi:CPA2 family monovalent cation:H+ antiporter-2
LKSALWLVAMICSLPMFIATSRKLQALGLLVAETKVSKRRRRTHHGHSILVAQVVPVAGTVCSGFLCCAKLPLLTTFKTFLVLLILAA